MTFDFWLIDWVGNEVQSVFWWCHPSSLQSDQPEAFPADLRRHKHRWVRVDPAGVPRPQSIVEWHEFWDGGQRCLGPSALPAEARRTRLLLPEPAVWVLCGIFRRVLWSERRQLLWVSAQAVDSDGEDTRMVSSCHHASLCRCCLGYGGGLRVGC